MMSESEIDGKQDMLDDLTQEQADYLEEAGRERDYSKSDKVEQILDEIAELDLEEQQRIAEELNSAIAIEIAKHDPEDKTHKYGDGEYIGG